MNNISVHVLLLIFAISFLSGCGDAGKNKQSQTVPKVVQSDSTASEAPPTKIVLPAEDTLPEIGKNLAELKVALAASETELNSSPEIHTAFRILGKIIDRETDQIDIFGTAIPLDNDASRVGCVYENGNLIVIHPEKDKITPFNYEGFHYFKKKTVGKNAFGAEVPVYVYGDEPDSLHLLRNKRSSLALQCAELKSRADKMLSNRFAEILPEIEAALIDASKLLDSSKTVQRAELPTVAVNADLLSKRLNASIVKLNEFLVWSQEFPERRKPAKDKFQIVKSMVETLGSLPTVLQWNFVSSKSETALLHASELFASQKYDTPFMSTKDDIVRLLKRMEADQQDYVIRATNVVAELKDGLSELNKFANDSTRFSEYVSKAQQQTMKLQSKLEQTEMERSTDTRQFYAYHSEFIQRFANIETVDDLERTLKIIHQAKIDSPLQWKLGEIVNAYDSWFVIKLQAFGRDDNRQKLTLEEINRLIEILPAIVNGANLSIHLEGLEIELGRRAIASSGKKPLATANAWISTRSLELPKPVREHHIELINRLNTIESIDGLVRFKQTVLEDSKASNIDWQKNQGELLHLYASLQRKQWAAYLATAFSANDARDLLALQNFGDWRFADQAKWVALSKQIGPERIHAINTFLEGGMIDSNVSESVLNKTSELAFWNNLLFAYELSADSTAPQFEINPYALLRALKLSGEPRNYHFALLSKFNKNRKPAEMCAMKRDLQTEMSLHPEMWTLAIDSSDVRHFNTISDVYSFVQSYQLKSYLESLGKRIPDAHTAYHKFKGSLQTPADVSVWTSHLKAFVPSDLRHVVRLLLVDRLEPYSSYNIANYRTEWPECTMNLMSGWDSAIWHDSKSQAEVFTSYRPEFWKDLLADCEALQKSGK